jgi:hypothetical protein
MRRIEEEMLWTLIVYNFYEILTLWCKQCEMIGDIYVVYPLYKQFVCLYDPRLILPDELITYKITPLYENG